MQAQAWCDASIKACHGAFRFICRLYNGLPNLTVFVRGEFVTYRLIQAAPNQSNQSWKFTPFLGAHVFHEPLVNGRFFFFVFSLMFVFFFNFFSYPNIADDKTYTTKITVHYCGGSQDTCTKNQNISLKNGEDIWPFVRDTCAFCALDWYLLSFSQGSIFGVIHELMLALRSQIFENLRDCFYRHALKYGTGSFRKKCEKKGYQVFPMKTPDCYWPFLRPVIGRDTAVSPLAPALEIQVKKLAMPPSSFFHRSWW